MSAASQIAALVFASTFLLAGWTIATMFAAYRDKMVAALLFEPIPRDTPIIVRSRGR